MSAFYSDVPAGLKMENMDGAVAPHSGLAYWSQRLLTADCNLTVGLKDKPGTGWRESADQSILPVNDGAELFLDSDPDSDLPI